MSARSFMKRNSVYIILGIVAIFAIIATQSSQWLQGFLTGTFTAPSGIGVQYEQYVTPDANGKVTIVFSSHNVTSNNKLNGYTFDIGSMPTSGVSNIDFSPSGAVNNQSWFSDDNINRSPMRASAVGTNAFTNDVDLLTLTFDVSSSFSSAVLTVNGTLETDVNGNESTETFAAGTITVLQRSNLALDYYIESLDDNDGEVIIFAKNLGSTQLKGIDFELKSIPNQLNNLDTNNNGLDTSGWTEAVNFNVTPILGSYVGNNPVGGTPDMFAVTFDINGTLPSNSYFIVDAKLILSNNTEILVDPLLVYLNNDDYSDVEMIVTSITRDGDEFYIMLAADNLADDLRINGADLSVYDFPSEFEDFDLNDEDADGDDTAVADENWTVAKNLSNLNNENAFVLTSVGTNSIGSDDDETVELFGMEFDIDGETDLDTEIMVAGTFIVNGNDTQPFEPLEINLEDLIDDDDDDVEYIDQNANNYVNIGDLGCVTGTPWRETNADEKRADINTDDIVNVKDLALLLGGWQPNTSIGGACRVYKPEFEDDYGQVTSLDNQ